MTYFVIPFSYTSPTRFWIHILDSYTLPSNNDNKSPGGSAPIIKCQRFCKSGPFNEFWLIFYLPFSETKEKLYSFLENGGDYDKSIS